MELKHIDFDQPHFEANGTKYYIKNTLTVERFIEFEKLQNHFGFGLSFSQVVERLNKSIDFANKGKGVEAWNVIFNLRDGIAGRIEDRTHPALLICTLFIVTEKEDITTWNEKEQSSKLEDWRKEGIDIQDFFQLTSNFVKDFIKIYRETSQNISQIEREMMKRKGKKSTEKGG